MGNIAKPFFSALGLICVGLAIVGIFLPLLPTTPFLLLAALLFSRSSEKLHGWLLSNRWFGEYIRNYRESRGIYLKHKIAAISILWLTISYSAFWVVSMGWLRALLLAGAAAVTGYLLTLKTLRPGRKTDS